MTQPIQRENPKPEKSKIPQEQNRMASTSDTSAPHEASPLIYTPQDSTGAAASTTTAYAVGDIHLQPNIGETNAVAGEFTGQSLFQILKYLQLCIIGVSVTVIVFELISVIFRIFNPSELVMGLYLAFFASLLLRVEIAMAFFKPDHPVNIGLPNLRNNFGILFTPVGRTFFLLMLGTLCIAAQDTIWEWMLGAIYVACAFMTIYTYACYPDYRRRQHAIQERVIQDNQKRFLETARRGAAGSTSVRSWASAAASTAEAGDSGQGFTQYSWRVTSAIAEASTSITNVSRRSNNNSEEIVVF